MKKKFLSLVLVCFMALSVVSGCVEKKEAVDYTDEINWAYLEKDESNKKADVFFINPTVFGGSEENHNMEMSDEETKKNFLGAINMEKGIYDDNCRFFAPYYRQISLELYSHPAKERESYLDIAYEDIKNAFELYLDKYNNGRPIILAGFSQGGELSVRLLKDYFKDEKLNDKLICCYAIGWSVTEEEMEENPHLRFAEAEDDTGVIVSFNSEAEDVGESFIISADEKTLSINPLNWKTDSIKADKSLNKGACFTDYDGNILKEIKNLTGAYIDEKRGVLKVTDVNKKDYPPVIDVCDEGVYHLYDYQFFYRNLEENVNKRIESYLTR